MFCNLPSVKPYFCCVAYPLKFKSYISTSFKCRGIFSLSAIPYKLRMTLPAARRCNLKMFTAYLPMQGEKSQYFPVNSCCFLILCVLNVLTISICRLSLLMHSLYLLKTKIFKNICFNNHLQNSHYP